MAANANVYELIALVSGELAVNGISKDRKNEQQHYKFRGIDDVYNALAPILVKHKLVILPRILTRECVERTAKSGSAQFFVTVEAEFDFVAALNPDSKHTVRTFGEAQDSADKATNKAMSAAYKYAAFQTFCIPTEGDNDADAHAPEASQPSGVYVNWLADLEIVAESGLDALLATIKASPEELQSRLRTDASSWRALKKKAEAAKGEMAHA